MKIIKKLKWFSVIIAAIAIVFTVVLGKNLMIKAANKNTITVKIENRNVTKKVYSLEKGKKAELDVPKSVKSVSFQSLKKDIAVVSKDGVITAKKKGTTKIRITAIGKNNKQESTWVKIKVIGTGTKIKITVGDEELTATLYDNATARAFAKKFPITLPMMDLYDREMCYRFSEKLPAKQVEDTGYEVGEIVYWPPGHSIVILYDQNGEEFDMQKVGYLDSGVEIFDGIGDVDVTFELLD